MPGPGKPDDADRAPGVTDAADREGVPPGAPSPALAVLTVVAVAIGVVARFSVGHPLWLDEALTAHISALPVGEIADALARDGHPPLHYHLLHWWATVVGEGELALRALSGVLGVACLPLAWIAGRRLAGTTGAQWALVVTALSPFAVRYATEVRMYSLVMLLVLAGYLLVTDALERPTAPRLAGIALVGTGLLWSHYWAVFLLGSVGLVVLVRWWTSSGPVRVASGRVALALVGSGVLFMPWLPTLLDQLASTGTPWAAPSRPTQVVMVTLDDLGGGGWAEARLHGALTLALLVVALLGVRAGRTVVLSPRPVPTVRWELAVVALTLGVGSVVAFAGRSAYASRYAAVVVPLVLLAVAVGLTVLPHALQVVAAAAWVLTALVGLAENALEPRTSAGDVAGALVAGWEPGDVVVACPDQLGVSLQRVLDRRGTGTEVVPYPTGGNARFVDWRDYEERNAAADPVAFADAVDERAGDGAVWVLWSGTYRTFEGACEAVLGRLGATRPATTEHEREGRFEEGELWRFGPP